jgi:hypothetical protein
VVAALEDPFPGSTEAVSETATRAVVVGLMADEAREAHRGSRA